MLPLHNAHEYSVFSVQFFLDALLSFHYSCSMPKHFSGNARRFGHTGGDDLPRAMAKPNL